MDEIVAAEGENYQPIDDEEDPHNDNDSSDEEDEAENDLIESLDDPVDENEGEGSFTERNFL